LSLLLFFLLELRIHCFSGEPIPFFPIERIRWDLVSSRDQSAHDDLVASFVPVLVVSSLAAEGMEKPDVKELLTIDSEELGIAELLHIGGIIIHVLSIRGHGLSLSFGLSERHPKGQVSHHGVGEEELHSGSRQSFFGCPHPPPPYLL
jgi:hypothetical protein